MQWFALEEQGSSPGPGGMGGCEWVGCIPGEEGRSAEVTGEGDNSVGSEAVVILAERQKIDCTEEKVEACWPVGRHMAGAMAEEMAEEMVEEMVYTVDTVVAAEYMPGPRRSDPAEENTRILVNGGRKPLL